MKRERDGDRKRDHVCELLTQFVTLSRTEIPLLLHYALLLNICVTTQTASIDVKCVFTDAANIRTLIFKKKTTNQTELELSRTSLTIKEKKEGREGRVGK